MTENLCRGLYSLYKNLLEQKLVDLSFQPSTTQEREEYCIQLFFAHSAWKLCLNLRREYRDLCIPPCSRDEGHEEILENMLRHIEKIEKRLVEIWTQNSV